MGMGTTHMPLDMVPTVSPVAASASTTVALALAPQSLITTVAVKSSTLPVAVMPVLLDLVS